MIGRTVSHYRILEKLGQGGMGVVYKAEDTRLKRAVALKFLRPDALASEDEKGRFLREAQAAASLDHPNICTIYEIGESDGRSFLAMAYIEGQSLKARIQAGPMKIEEALEIAAQVAHGLQEAHEKGIVHRDIKSANIMVTAKGQAKIMDFGLALLAGQTRVTRTGTAVGTPAYMSPEQAQGDAVDRRTDLWSLGVVLHEAVTGQLPFRGSSEVAVVHSILSSAAEPLSSLRTGVPLELERIVNKALAKRPAERYQHADEVLADLSALKRQLESGSARTTGTRAAAPPSIAVLPFVNMNRDEESEFFSDGMTEELISALTKVAQLRVVSRTSAFQFKGKTQDIREIGEKLKVGMALEGSVRRAGNRVRVTAQLVNIADGYQIWSERYDREMKDVFDIQDEIARSIVEALKIKLAGGQEGPLVKRCTENLEAYGLYLKGLHHSQRWALTRSIACFEQATALDPNYAPAYAGLAGTYANAALWSLAPLSEIWPKARAAAAKALALDESLGVAHSAMGLLQAWYEYDWAGAERSFRRALELNPGDATIRSHAANFAVLRGRLDEGMAEARRALDRDPLSLPVQTQIGWCFWFFHQYDQAIEQSRKVLELDPGYLEAQMALGCAYTTKGAYEQAVDTFEKARSAFPAVPLVLGMLGWAYGWWGKRAEAGKLLEQLKEMVKTRSASIHISWICNSLGEKAEALDWMERAYEERDAMVPYIKVAPAYDNLRSEPRFIALLKKMGLE